MVAEAYSVLCVGGKACEGVAGARHGEAADVVVPRLVGDVGLDGAIGNEVDGDAVRRFVEVGDDGCLTIGTGHNADAQTIDKGEVAPLGTIVDGQETSVGGEVGRIAFPHNAIGGEGVSPDKVLRGIASGGIAHAELLLTVHQIAVSEP